MGRHLRGLGSQFSIPLPLDSDGFLGRECPKCFSYFKITPGTGLEGVTRCTCAYCGHCGEQSEFGTEDQISFARSVVFQQVTNAIGRDLKDMARSFNRRMSGNPLGIKISTSTRSRPLKYYSEKDLETLVECDNCSLRYAIYGVFGYCPDCSLHNSRQILEKNIQLVRRQISLAEATEDRELSDQLLGDGLENAVSAFDGFGRSLVASHSSKASNPMKAANLSFQNLDNAADCLKQLFCFDLRSGLPEREWKLLSRGFHKRHLLAHKMGVVDEKYITATEDTSAVFGRKISITLAEVQEMAALVLKIGQCLSDGFSTTSSASSA